MKAAIATSRMICILLGVIHLFGQLFFGVFEVSPTIAGISGILAGSLSPASRTSAKFLLFVVPVGVLAIGAGAYDYYATEQVPGNYYAWPEALVFTGALLIIVYGAQMNLRKRDIQHV